VLADHYDRRRIITIFQSIEMLCPIVLVVLLATGTIRPWIVIGLSLVVGVTDAISMPCYQSIVPSMVRHDQIAAGIALSSTQYNLSRIISPAAANLLGLIGCFAANAISYIPFILVALWILPRHAAATTPVDHPRIRAELWAASKPRVRAALLVVFATSVLCSPLITFCPILVRDAFGGNDGDFSLVVAAFGIGGLLGALALLGLAQTRKRRRVSSWSAVAAGGFVLASAVATRFRLLPLSMLLAGFALTASNTCANTLLQTNGAEGRRGQTVSMYMLAIRCGMAIGSVVTGASVHALGVRSGIAINGALAIVVQLILGRMWWRADRPTIARDVREV
jgi:predicted MFS family arabinose efflux permease